MGQLMLHVVGLGELVDLVGQSGYVLVQRSVFVTVVECSNFKDLV